MHQTENSLKKLSIYFKSGHTMENQNILDIYTYKRILYNKNILQDSFKYIYFYSCSVFVINVKPAFKTMRTPSVSFLSVAIKIIPPYMQHLL